MMLKSVTWIKQQVRDLIRNLKGLQGVMLMRDNRMMKKRRKWTAKRWKSEWSEVGEQYAMLAASALLATAKKRSYLWSLKAHQMEGA